MEPMKPMAPMEPMKPIEPISGGTVWWPADLDHTSTSGAQNDQRYAFFPDKHRLLIEQNGRLAIYDSGDHRIGGVAQQASAGPRLSFTSQHGPVRLDDLKRVD